MIHSDVVIVHGVMHFKTLRSSLNDEKSFARLHKLKQTKFMEAGGKSNSSLHIEECDST